MRAAIDPELTRLSKGSPAAELDLIVRVHGDPQAVARALPKGVRVRRTFTLSPGLAVTAPASALADIAATAGVTSIEPDRDVHSQRG